MGSKLVKSKYDIINNGGRPFLVKSKYHDNGGRPFLVKDLATEVSVYKQSDEKSFTQLFNVKYEKIFIGDDMDKGQHKGNSILLKLSKHKYMFIGWNISTFKVPKNYYSPIGNNDVPYPYAIGEKYTYLMLENVYIPTELLDFSDDVYNYYYNFFNKKVKSLRMKLMVDRLY